MHEPELPPPRHEPSDVGMRLIWIGVPAVLLGIVALAGLVMKLYPRATVDRTLQLPLPHYPAPELQTDPVGEMMRLRVMQRWQLSATGWVDAQHAVAHVPIDDALRQVAAQGIADWPAAAGEDSRAP